MAELYMTAKSVYAMPAWLRSVFGAMFRVPWVIGP